jgi:hypothetical protein
MSGGREVTLSISAPRLHLLLLENGTVFVRAAGMIGSDVAVRDSQTSAQSGIVYSLMVYLMMLSVAQTLLITHKISWTQNGSSRA